jgi:hypothetical protein
MIVETLFELEQLIPHEGNDARVTKIHVDGMPGDLRISYDIMVVQTDEIKTGIMEADLIPQP